MKNYYLGLMILFMSLQVSAQYKFTHTIDIPCTTVKNQANTGTCWSFATTSFIEAELMRKGFKDVDLSEMYVVRNIYRDKAYNYMLRQGKANFSQGSLSHDLIRAISKHGILPEQVYSGMLDGQTRHDHSEMENALLGFLDGVRKSANISAQWPIAFDGILDAYMGAAPANFTYKDKSYTPFLFARYLGFNADDYMSLTSFTHHDFYKSFILEIPDNYSNGSYFNIPLDDLIKVIDDALSQGYTVAWDGDVSEKSFSAGSGIAILPEDTSRKDMFDQPGNELMVTQALRQEKFMNYATTDDHLMHIVGKAKDQNGTEYYIIKNSWGEISEYQGYLYMSKAYVKMKTIAIMLHKDALSESLKNKLAK